MKVLHLETLQVNFSLYFRELGERLDHVEIELQNEDNSSIVSKLVDDVKVLEENLQHLNSSIGESLVPGVMTMNSSIGNVLIPRLETLETEAVRRNETEELEVKMTNLLNGTELFRVALIDLWSDIQNIQSKLMYQVLKGNNLKIDKQVIWWGHSHNFLVPCVLIKEIYLIPAY